MCTLWASFDPTTHTRGPITGRAPAPLAQSPITMQDATEAMPGDSTLPLCRHQPASLAPITTLGEAYLGPFQSRAYSHNAKVKAQAGPHCPCRPGKQVHTRHSLTRAGRATGNQGSVPVHFLPRKHLNPALPSPPLCSSARECHFSNPGSSWSHCLNSIFFQLLIF